MMAPLTFMHGRNGSSSVAHTGCANPIFFAVKLKTVYWFCKRLVWSESL